MDSIHSRLERLEAVVFNDEVALSSATKEEVTALMQNINDKANALTAIRKELYTLCNDANEMYKRLRDLSKEDWTP